MKTIALIGNPNCGKTTLFNQLTGTTAYVGNWPGVTVEKKEGVWNGYRVLDLPGIYSLSPYSPEEKVSRRYVLDERPDLIVDVIDATNLERSLYLTTQLIELGRPVLLVLNMLDLLEKDGITIDEEKLELMTGSAVVSISASKNIGMDHFTQHVKELMKNGKSSKCILFSGTVEKYITHIIEDDYLHQIPKGRTPRWAAIKLLEEDPLFMESMPPLTPEIKQYLAQARFELSSHYNDEIEAIIIDQRYKVAEKITTACLTRKLGKEKFSFDTIATNRFAALPLFALIMALVFYLSVGLVGGYTTIWLEEAFSAFGEALRVRLDMWGVIPFLSGLLIDGIISGVGSVLTFVPQLFVLFLLLSLLEDCGYMARIAFIMDRIMRSLGLSGKSIIPLVIGTGCSVPGIMCTRTIEHEKQRELTIVVTPFIPCGAKMPVFSLMIASFFPGAWYMAPAIYFLGILAVVVTGLISQAFDRHKEQNTFIMELPRYQIPTLKNTGLQTWERTRGFLLKAGTIILLASALIYILQSYSFTLHAATPEESILASIGILIAPIFAPLGFGSWQATVALLTGIAAKESIVSTLEITGVAENISAFFTPAAAAAFISFILLSSPCVAALSAMAKELGSKRKFIHAVVYQMGLAYLVSFIIYLVVGAII